MLRSVNGWRMMVALSFGLSGGAAVAQTTAGSDGQLKVPVEEVKELPVSGELKLSQGFSSNYLLDRSRPGNFIFLSPEFSLSLQNKIRDDLTATIKPSLSGSFLPLDRKLSREGESFSVGLAAELELAKSADTKFSLKLDTSYDDAKLPKGWNTIQAFDYQKLGYLPERTLTLTPEIGFTAKDNKITYSGSAFAELATAYEWSTDWYIPYTQAYLAANAGKARPDWTKPDKAGKDNDMTRQRYFHDSSNTYGLKGKVEWELAPEATKLAVGTVIKRENNLEQLARFKNGEPTGSERRTPNLELMNYELSASMTLKPTAIVETTTSIKGTAQDDLVFGAEDALGVEVSQKVKIDLGNGVTLSPSAGLTRSELSNYWVSWRKDLNENRKFWGWNAGLTGEVEIEPKKMKADLGLNYTLRDSNVPDPYYQYDEFRVTSNLTYTF